MEYRKEIDGLRALAVVPVIFFHAGISKFSGGFVGVDVFFVISGFLITSIILAELDAGRFSIANFYERRARRILPALFVVMLVCLPLAWKFLLPQEMDDFAQSVLAVPAFASNILFWRTSGYFSPAAELKPLLHTWSLAVEEQYYVIFPLLLMVFWRLNKRRIMAVLIGILIASLALAEYAVVVEPDAAFYMLPTRGWELLIGALVALFFAIKKNVQIPKMLNECLSAFGIALILYAIFCFSKSTRSPSLLTLIPTAGAAFIIIASRKPTVAGNVLGCRLMVGIGLISYSAYLWHQPMLAFAKHASLGEPSQIVLGLLACSSFVLAYLTWKYVETPFRDKRRFDRRKLVVFSVAGSAAFVAFGFAGSLSNGFAFRLSDDKREFLASFENSTPAWHYYERVGLLAANRSQCDFYDLVNYRAGHPVNTPIAAIAQECYARNPAAAHSVYLWGDSHAQHLYSGLKVALPTDWQILQGTTSGCQADLGARPSRVDYCAQSNWFAYKNIAEIKPEVVIVAQNLHQNVQNMQRLGRSLLAAGAKKVIFIGPTPHWHSALPSLVVRTWETSQQRTRVGLNQRVLELDATLKRDFPQSNDMKYVSVIDHFCDQRGCAVYLGSDRRDGLTSHDYGHLTPIASTDFAKNILAAEVVGLSH
jgi:peptidoglycan/LPS O-acetylase OafA/YrhL